VTPQSFPLPFMFKEHRTCRKCGCPVIVYCLNGATVPRDPYFTGGCCMASPVATDAVIEREQRPQLSLVKDVDG
jgi:hypothetical protein